MLVYDNRVTLLEEALYVMTEAMAELEAIADKMEKAPLEVPAHVDDETQKRPPNILPARPFRGQCDALPDGWIKWTDLFKLGERIERAAQRSGPIPIQQAIKQRDTLYKRKALEGVDGEPTGDREEDRRRVMDARNEAERSRLDMTRLLRFSEVYRKAAGVHVDKLGKYQADYATAAAYAKRRDDWMRLIYDIAEAELDYVVNGRFAPILSAAFEVTATVRDKQWRKKRDQQLKESPPPPPPPGNGIGGRRHDED